MEGNIAEDTAGTPSWKVALCAQGGTPGLWHVDKLHRSRNTPKGTAASTPEQERYKKQGAEEEKSRKQGVVD